MAYKSKPTLIGLMRDVFDFNLADAICDTCFHSDESPWTGVIHPDRISSPAIYAAWTTPQACTYIDDGMAKRAAKKGKGNGSGSNLLSSNPLLVSKAAIALLSEHFIITGESGQTVYRIVNRDHRIVEVCSPLNLTAQVSQSIKETLWKIGVPASKGLTGHFLDYFLHNAPQQPAPKLWAQRDDDCWCLGRALLQPDATVPWPNMRSVFDRMNDGEALAAWYWGVYSGEYHGRQSPYLSDPTGLGNKSSLGRVLQKQFNLGLPEGSRHTGVTAALNWNILNDSSHASAHFAGKKFVWVGDNKNPNILMSQAVKQLSGDDMSMLNPKHLSAYSDYLEAKLLVLANCEPHITSERHSISRILWIKLAKLEIADSAVDWKFAASFDAEMPGFLAWAKECYQRRCSNDTVIFTNQAVQDAVALKITEYEDQFSVPFHEHFILDHAGAVPAAQLAEVMFTKLRWHKFEVEHFKEWLERTFDIHKTRTARGWAYKGLRLRAGHDHYSDPEAEASPYSNGHAAPPATSPGRPRGIYDLPAPDPDAIYDAEPVEYEA
jgi:hypothetical protein